MEREQMSRENNAKEVRKEDKRTDIQRKRGKESEERGKKNRCLEKTRQRK